MTIFDRIQEQMDMEIAKLKAKVIAFFNSTWKDYFTSVWKNESRDINLMKLNHRFLLVGALFKRYVQTQMSLQRSMKRNFLTSLVSPNVYWSLGVMCLPFHSSQPIRNDILITTILGFILCHILMWLCSALSPSKTVTKLYFLIAPCSLPW